MALFASSTSVPPSGPTVRRLSAGPWVDLGILLLAAGLRLWALELRPAHFDEGVNGFLVDGMGERGFYAYNPTKFHGPLHFYVLYTAEALLGRGLWALRLPVALVSLACVALATFGFRQIVPVRAARLFALAMAVSPGFVYYGRDSIHETWLVFFLLLLVLGLAGLWRDGAARHLWLAGGGLAGAIVTKETWLVHAVALALAVPVLRLLERFLPSSPRPFARRRWTWIDLLAVTAAGSLAVLALYSGFFRHWSGVDAFFQSFGKWMEIGTVGRSGQEKPWWYWLRLLRLYEWPALVGGVAAVGVGVAGKDRLLRWLAIGSLGTFAAYALAAYKTPWCLLAWGWPFCLFFGIAADRLLARWRGGAPAVLVALVCAASLGRAVSLTFRHFTDDREPYVFVQTTLEIDRLLDPLRWQAARDPASVEGRGHVIQTEHFPMLWLLGRRPNVTWGGAHHEPRPMDAEWLLVAAPSAARIEAQLTEPYFREQLRLRGDTGDRSVLYLRAASFADYFPGRRPELQAPAGFE